MIEKKDLLSWVDGISEFAYKEDLTTITLQSDESDAWSAETLTEEAFNAFFNQLKKSKGYTFTDKEKETYSCIMSDFAWENDCQTWWMAFMLEWDDPSISYLSPLNGNISISYLPIMESIKNQFTDRTIKQDLHVFLINRSAHRLLKGDQVMNFDAHGLLGAYIPSAHAIVCDLTMLDDSKCLVHELLHCVIDSLRSYLDEAMYDTAENKREEICVHFMTDGYERLNFIHTNFGQYKFERDASHFEEDDNYIHINDRKCRNILTSAKKSQNYYVNKSSNFMTSEDVKAIKAFSRTSASSEKRGSAAAIADMRASFNSLKLSEPLKSFFDTLSKNQIKNRKLWRYKKCKTKKI